MDDVVVNLGDRGDVKVDRLAADDDADDVETLRKTRAGGNWLMGGMLEEVYECRCRVWCGVIDVW